MRLLLHSRHRQQGGVAVVFALTVGVLFAMGGIVLDLGHLYVAKAELQNGADAAALSGAKELNQTSAGITNAVVQAQQIASKNKYNFSTDLTLTAANIEFGPAPDGPWSAVATAVASPQGKTFIKVDTGAKTMDTYLMRVAGSAFNTISTSGIAVAGRYVVDVTPLGVCAIDPANKTSVKATASGINELVELGFRRGITYNILALGPLGAAGVPMLLNPVDSPPTSCLPSHSSANFTAPFVCQGNSAVGAGSTVYANTGGSYGPIERAVNSRFDDYPGGSSCDPTTAPPDSNVKDYGISLAPPGRPADWMNPDPVRQSVRIDPATAKPISWPANPPGAADFGVLWSYSPAVRAAGSAPNYSAGAPFTTSDWADLYNIGLAASSYPTSGTPPSPYKQTSGPFFAPAAVHPPGTPARRVLKVVIVDCAGLGGGGLSCAPLPVKGVGRFFLQSRADLTGSPKTIYGEFAGLVESVPASEIKLYR